jgi:hypothetical protein
LTAEIAILNKAAVALATDSAVTISNGNQAVKIFESADKLFELSTEQPIGIMIYNGMQFMGMPFEAIIKGFRRNRGSFKNVKNAADAFLQHLYEYVDTAPESELRNAVRSVIGPIAQEIGKKINEQVLNALRTDDAIAEGEALDDLITKAQEQVLSKYEERLSRFDPASFIARKARKKLSAKYRSWVRESVQDAAPGITDAARERIAKLCVAVLKSSHISNARTGLVIAGFGEEERFPTLVAFEIDGIFEGLIRYRKTDDCDIDRRGPRAYVRPFAQKDMVDRFLHGLDDRLREAITKYCGETVGKISKGIFDSITIADEGEREKLMNIAKEAEEAFLKNLSENVFRTTEMVSTREIEDMVEFMPKPELAKMAEALIDLTSIKRKVSQGMETVGGPVDVAVISKNDGFVWIKRKHYFPADINSRYFERNIRPRQAISQRKGTEDG